MTPQGGPPREPLPLAMLVRPQGACGDSALTRLPGISQRGGAAADTGS